MKLWTTSVLSFAVSGMLGNAAFAQGEGADNQISPFQMTDSTVLVVSAAGLVTERKLSDPSVAAMILKEGKPMAAGTIVYMRGKDLFIAKDRKMASGQMLSALATKK